MSIHSTDPDIEVIMYDEDNIGSGDQPPIPQPDMYAIQKDATENIPAITKFGNFYTIY
ncbi:MAG: hypothetical protein WC222_11585 [Parachlamydiales bacterium]